MKESTIPPVGFGFLETPALSAAGLEGLLANPDATALFDLLPIAVVLVGPEGQVRLFNRNAESFFGLRRADVLGGSFGRLRRDSLLDLEDFLAECERGREAGVVRMRAGTGSFVARRQQLAVDGARRGALLYCLSPGGAPGERRRARTGQAPAAATDELLIDPAIDRLLDKAALAATRKSSVLVLGETGVGKSVLARRIHERSERRNGPFVHVNCGSISESLFESELFGYERGAFTGALQAGKRGYIESAAGGTLFLDEIGEIPLHCQPKLLRFLEDGSTQPVGSSHVKRVDATIVSATNRDLRAMVDAGSFRRDLYFRIAAFTIELPSLKGRAAIDAMIDVQLARINRDRQPALRLSSACRKLLLCHRYEGNIRELRNVIEHLSIMADEVAQPEHLPDYVVAGARGAPAERRESAGSSEELRARVRRFEREAIAEAVSRCGSKREAARRLGIDVATLIRKSRET